MYCEFFGLRDYPFLSTIDRRFFYISDVQSQARHYLQYLLEIRDGIVVLTGLPGSGKTVLVDQVLRDLPTRVSSACVQHSLLSDEEFLLSVCMQFDCIPDNWTKPDLFNAIREFAMERHLTMNPVLLVVEDAQNLNPNVLEEIRQLASMEMFGRKLIQIILTGLPELEDMLSGTLNEALAQHIRLSHRLEPLGKRELSEYIDYRLYVAGNDGRIVFSGEILDGILAYTGGIPRLVNQLCDMMLVTGFIRQTNLMDASCLKSAVKKLAWPRFSDRKQKAGFNLQEDIDIRPVPVLVIREGNRILRRVLLNKRRIFIGRQPGIDIMIDDPSVARVHAQLVNMDRKFFIHDLNHRNDLLFQGVPVKWHSLSHGDVLALDRYQIEYQCTASVKQDVEPDMNAAIA